MPGGRTMLLAPGLLLLALALLSGPSSAECPNGCSGNGACMAKDMCDCYKNYQGNDCLDRTCQFGYAHADTPKGDLDMDQDRRTAGWILDKSQQEPAGTYEYFNPDAATNEAHFYMECSNKGLCDRSLGMCTCFDGYEGVACERAACPNKCSGHGTCESIRELGVKAPGTLFGVPTNADEITYDLWDSRVSYGCRCDPWYYGADCSLRSCKVGVDPMFLSAGSATYATFVVHAWIATGSYAPEVANAPIANYLLPAVSNTPVENYLRLRLFDYNGESFITDKIPILTDFSDPAVATAYATASGLTGAAITAAVATAATNAAANKISNAAAVQAAIENVPSLTFQDVLCEPIGDDILSGYQSTRLASSPGLSVVCQFQDNPGKLRAPEVAAYSFKGVVDPADKDAAVYTLETGTDDEWFTVDTGLAISSITTGTAVVLTGTAVWGSSVPTALALYKVGPHVVLGAFTSNTVMTLTFPLKHTVGSEDVFMAQGTFTLTEITVTASAALTAVPPGQDYLLFAASSGLQPGNTIFFENQFYTVQASRSTTPFTVRLDRPFSGNSLNGGVSTVNLVYKVVLPAGLVDKTQLYNYVSPCSGRGLCGADTGVCTCFKGYTTDNCDTQNILAL